ncbi:hypothetical protein ABB37_09087 [Leptomonas pyrrhocoris]|uniref:Uncharacterized protein n=1 Tax=Leptomonas pyrrhocoris TaxID=157538 RepID=A0A0M9FR57_LEPPY|nr:hypothetical protein ABB37_09087 [Leptomonas pyrrhocoris]XP_015652815.1 hypothetical protein ABB37_09087 [Leptomonas pyrrhocoris]KPA74375.1 hypothetical protein ABB37_09087 [Leptomonas pyrrhocoris]KPA74376.1 hypothetical protein ABB37_09087 [Leptomonas pyrrhocoris]|eukprot:XP_015652814.1 hypothetical protein ABB37_09087 [Leptomonas pyrrhocoris]
MSVDPAINAALLNMCAQVQDSGGNRAPSAGTSTAGVPASSTLAVAPSTTTSALGTNNDATINKKGDNSSSRGAPTPASHLARPASDYAWLRDALASVESPEKRVKQLLLLMENKAVDGGDSPVEVADRLEALEELSDMVEDVNWAAEFTLMEGPQRVLRVLRRERSAHPLTTISDPLSPAEGEAAEPPGEVTLNSISLYTQLAMIIAHSSQLNEPVQVVYCAAHWEEVLLRLVWDTIKAVEKVWCVPTRVDVAVTAASNNAKLMRLLAALLHACSCLCRECPPNTIQFLQHGGLAVLAAVLQLTRTVVSTVPATSAAGAPGVVTTIDESNEGDSEDYAQVVGGANKVTSRVLFFLRYLASTGVSSEEVIQLSCQHAQENADEAVQKAVAQELLELVAKNPKMIKEAVHTHMPKRFYEWKKQLQHMVGDAAESGKDERQRFVEALDESN